MGRISVDQTLIKKPYQQVSYTKEQLLEFVKCADPVSGPEYFLSNYFWVQHPTKGKIKYKPYSYQLKLIDSYHNYRLSCAMIPRQAGKSVTAAGYLLWAAMFLSDQTILIAAHKLSGSKEIMTRIRFGYEACPDYLRAGITEYNKLALAFDNGSTIKAETTTETTSRGKSLSILYCDELAYVKKSIQTEFWTSCSMTISTGGKLFITSTPSSNEDLFATIWNGANKTQDEFGNDIPGGLGINGFKAFRAYWYEHPDRDDKWAAEQEQLIGKEKFQREMECEFIIDCETLIAPLRLNQLQGIEPIEKQGSIRWYSKPEKGNTYLVALDPSIGTGGDPAAIQILEAKTLKQIGEWTHNKTVIEKQVDLLKEITTYLVDVTEDTNKVFWSVENNTIGEAILVAIRNVGEENIPGIFLSEQVKLGQSRKFRKGFCTTNPTKLAACAKLKNLIESDRLKINSKKLVSELKTFIAIENTYKAKTGDTDDLVTAMLVIVRMMSALENYITDFKDDIEDSDEDIPLPFLVDFY
jgi:hypothetical protein